jgi:hypothetical protein
MFVQLFGGSEIPSLLGDFREMRVFGARLRAAPI